jgi:hypothetical protein
LYQLVSQRPFANNCTTRGVVKLCRYTKHQLCILYKTGVSQILLSLFLHFISGLKKCIHGSEFPPSTNIFIWYVPADEKSPYSSSFLLLFSFSSALYSLLNVIQCPRTLALHIFNLMSFSVSSFCLYLLSP